MGRLPPQPVDELGVAHPHHQVAGQGGGEVDVVGPEAAGPGAVGEDEDAVAARAGQVDHEGLAGPERVEPGPPRGVGGRGRDEALRAGRGLHHGRGRAGVARAQVHLHLAVAGAPDQAGGLGPQDLAQAGHHLPGAHVAVLSLRALVDEGLHQLQVAVPALQGEVGAQREPGAAGEQPEQHPADRAGLEQDDAQHAERAGRGHGRRGRHEGDPEVLPAQRPDLDADDEQQQRGHEDVDRGQAEVQGRRPLGGEHGEGSSSACARVAMSTVSSRQAATV